MPNRLLSHKEAANQIRDLMEQSAKKLPEKDRPAFRAAALGWLGNALSNIDMNGNKIL